MYLYHVFDTQIKKWECKHCRHPENMALYLGDQIRFLHLLNWGTKSSLSTIPHYYMLLWCQNMSTPEKQGFDHININKKIDLVHRIPLFLKDLGPTQAANGHTVAGEDEELVESNAGGARQFGIDLMGHTILGYIKHGSLRLYIYNLIYIYYT